MDGNYPSTSLYIPALYQFLYSLPPIPLPPLPFPLLYLSLLLKYPSPHQNCTYHPLAPLINPFSDPHHSGATTTLSLFS